ncbi:MAG: YkgJ family cysteine cluster protein [Anaerohalosphaera sp.]|nr:YkgJ family cysteine cluster protein [Anaerohalosphaera sp.]
MTTAIQRYRQLTREIDALANNLTGIHNDHILCAQRCCRCCIDLSVWPVEFYSILDQLRQAGITNLSFDTKASCGFLADSLCQLYQFRPLICRTHGLPIVFLNDDTNPPEYSVSFCDDNFTAIEPEKYEFNSANTLNIDDLNAKLYNINLAFLEEFPDKQLTDKTRIELRELIKKLETL